MYWITEQPQKMYLKHSTVQDSYFLLSIFNQLIYNQLSKI